MSDKLTEVTALAATLWFLPPPARAQLAPELFDLGVRVHPELATKRLVREGPAQLGNHAPQRLESINAMSVLRSMNSELAERVEQARAQAAAGDDTEARRLADELRPTIAADRHLLAQHSTELAGLIPADPVEDGDQDGDDDE